MLDADYTVINRSRGKVGRNDGLNTKRVLKARYLIGLASLATGAALLVYFLAGLSLLYSAALTVTLSVGAAYVVWRSVNMETRRVVQRRAKVGLLSGALATVGYDLSRFLLVQLGDFTIRPFETWRLFGQLLIGENAPILATTAVGTTYHVVNGLSFAVAYTLLFGDRGWKAGIAWALGLEILMVTFYPGWLGLRALDEFLSVSILGHVTYGFILGWCSRAFLTRSSPVTERRGV